MIVKRYVLHKVSFGHYIKHWSRRAINALPSYFIKPSTSETLFIFVAGCGHSGTTLMAARLSNHSKIMGIGRETKVLIQEKQSLRSVKAITNEWSYFSERLGNSCVLEKTPKHVHAYYRAQKVLPNNKFIILTRNPLDTIASLYKRFDDLDFCIDRWIIDNRAAAKLAGEKNVIHVKYEDFTEKPERTLKEVTQFLGLDYEGAMLSEGTSIYSRTPQRDNMRIREEQVSKPIKQNNNGWKNIFDQNQARHIMSRVKSVAENLGYTTHVS